MAKKEHVPFDEMVCPVRGRFAKRLGVESCTSLRGRPQEGSVPGIKRHVRAVHGKTVFDAVVWPPLRTGELADKERKRAAQEMAKRFRAMPVAALRKQAARKGIEVDGKTKPALIEALTS